MMYDGVWLMYDGVWLMMLNDTDNIDTNLKV